MSENSLRITEIFYSLQGEANTSGWPTVFIRLTGCPLRCHYCDTAYAFSGGQSMTLDEIRAEVSKYSARHITVTGGEPLAQPNCLALLQMLAEEGYQVSLETSGALDITKVDRRVSRVVDLKTPSSGEVTKNLYSNFDHLTSIDEIKCVIGDRADYDWAVEQINKYRLPERCNVIFSPCSGSLDATALADWILGDALPVRFQIQLHKLLWGDARAK